MSANAHGRPGGGVPLRRGHRQPTSDGIGGNDGTFAGDSEPTWVAPKVGSAALSFHGDGAYRGMGSRLDVQNSLNAVLGGTASLAAWMKTTQIDSNTF